MKRHRLERLMRWLSIPVALLGLWLWWLIVTKGY